MKYRLCKTITKEAKIRTTEISCKIIKTEVVKFDKIFNYKNIFTITIYLIKINDKNSFHIAIL